MRSNGTNADDKEEQNGDGSRGDRERKESDSSAGSTSNGNTSIGHQHQQQLRAVAAPKPKLSPVPEDKVASGSAMSQQSVPSHTDQMNYHNGNNGGNSVASAGLLEVSSNASSPRDPSNMMRTPDSVPLMQKVEDNYLMFAPVRASADRNFTNFGDVIKESRAILEMIRKALAASGLTMHDLVRVDVWMLDARQLRYFDEVYENYFKGVTTPQRNITIVESMADNCTVEVEVTSLLRDATANRYTPYPGFAGVSGNNAGNGPDAVSVASSHPHQVEVQGQLAGVFPLLAQQSDNMFPGPSDFGFARENLPRIIAEAWGYYGESWERLRSGMELKLGVRIALLICGVTSVASVSHTVNEFSQIPKRSQSWALAVSVLVLCQSAFLFGFCVTWIYFYSQANVRGQVLRESSPGCLRNKMLIVLVFAKYSDLILVFFTLSAFSALVSLIPVASSNNEQGYKICAVFLCLAWVAYMFAYLLDAKVLYTYRVHRAQHLDRSQNNQLGIRQHQKYQEQQLLQQQRQSSMQNQAILRYQQSQSRIQNSPQFNSAHSTSSQNVYSPAPVLQPQQDQQFRYANSPLQHQTQSPSPNTRPYSSQVSSGSYDPRAILRPQPQSSPMSTGSATGAGVHVGPGPSSAPLPSLNLDIS